MKINLQSMLYRFVATGALFLTHLLIKNTIPPSAPGLNLNFSAEFTQSNIYILFSDLELFRCRPGILKKTDSVFVALDDRPDKMFLKSQSPAASSNRVKHRVESHIT